MTVVSETLRATVFHGPGDIRVEEVARPRADAGEAVIRVTTTTPVDWIPEGRPR